MQSDEPVLRIYEIGAGNGTLCNAILDRIKGKGRSVEYSIIEASHSMHRQQKRNIRHAVNLHNCSFLDITISDSRPCFVLAFEVLDNLSHDIIKFDDDGDLLEGHVLENEKAEWGEEKWTLDFEKAKDPLIIDYINLLDKFDFEFKSLKWSPLKSLEQYFVYSYPWSNEFIPTSQLAFLNKLNRFPNHKLILSDFDSLNSDIKGHGAPIVQTVLEKQTVQSSKLLVQPGKFDIFFPTDFSVLQKMYREICKKDSEIISHRDAMKRYADYSQTRLKDGTNPLLEEYQNVKFLLGA